MQAEKIFIGKKPAVKYLPNNMAVGNLCSLVIFLHGMGERGDGSEAGLNKLFNSSNHKNLLAAGDANGFMVLAPQYCPNLNNYEAGWKGGTYVADCLDWAEKNLPVDLARVYLTGLSEGGGGVWDAITRKVELSKRFAAASPVCGIWATDCDWKAIADSHLPVWAYHAADDGSQNVGASRIQVAAANALNPDPRVKYTEYATGGHGIWGRVYADPEFYKWLLAQKRVTLPTEPAPVEKRVVAYDQVSNLVYFHDGSSTGLKSVLTDILNKITVLTSTEGKTYTIRA
jgi:predicted peptidase